MRLLKATWLQLIIVFVAGVILGGTSMVLAQDTNVRTTLCDATSAPQITVTSPLSDSVVDEIPLELIAITTRTTQIDIFINNAYSHSVAITPDGDLQTTVSLQEGDNTIRLDSYFSCNQTTANDTLVVTYIPKVVPSDGGNTDTDVDDVIQEPSAVTTSNDLSQGDDDSQEPKSPLDRLRRNLRLAPYNETTDSVQTPVSVATAFVNWLGLLAGITALAIFIAPVYFLTIIGAHPYEFIWARLQLKTFIRWLSLLLFIVFLLLLLL